MKPLVYIAGPYTADPVTYTRWAIQRGMDLWRTGAVAVIVPHLSLLADLVAPMEATDWYRFDHDLIAHCDAVVVVDKYALSISEGVREEVALAKRLGIPVFFDDDDVLTWAADR